MSEQKEYVITEEQIEKYRLDFLIDPNSIKLTDTCAKEFRSRPLSEEIKKAREDERTETLNKIMSYLDSVNGLNNAPYQYKRGAMCAIGNVKRHIKSLLDDQS